MRTETVTSAQNPKIKELLALQEKSRLRRERGLFIVEGRRELGHCIEAGYRVRTIFVCREIIPDTEAEAILRQSSGKQRQSCMSTMTDAGRLMERHKGRMPCKSIRRTPEEKVSLTGCLS